MIKFVLIGHVDVGKSSLAGRLLIETETIPQRDIEKAKNDANINNMKTWWLAYLLDIGSERTHGKTKEYTSIPLNNTNLTLIDVPGHRKYISEMIDGASFANVAVLVCSAKKGELQSGLKGQTFEHMLIARSSGISHIIIAVNKMDTIDWDMDKYEGIKKKITKIAKKLKYNSIEFVPISAYNGKNIDHLLSLIKNTNVDIQDEQKQCTDTINISANFFEINGLITAGYKCILHCGTEYTECEITDIDGKLPFVRSNQSTTVTIKLDKKINIGAFVILRNGDATIAIGKVN